MKNKYTILEVVFGAGIGLSVGILTNHISIGLVVGAGVGLVFETKKNNDLGNQKN